MDLSITKIFRMKKNKFKIRDCDGLLYSRFSGDFNKIHIDDNVGYNSIYGEKVCHGCNVFSKALNQIWKNYPIFKNSNYFSINFFKFFSYNDDILIEKKKNCFFLFQHKTLSAEIKFEKKNLLDGFCKKDYKYFYLKKKRLHKNKESDELHALLGNISKHVGMIFPGKNSIISAINVQINKSNKDIKNGIYSRLVKKGYPFVTNLLVNHKFIISFESLYRPFFKRKNIKPSNILSKTIKNIDSNILILGASGGLGYDLINLFKINKNIKIFGSYFKNKIKFTNKNIYIFRADIKKDYLKIINLINKENIATLYYFPSNKISLEATANQIYLYKKLFLEFPEKIINWLKNRHDKKIKFLYPSTVFIEGKNKNSDYSKIKKKAEKILKNICKKNNSIDLKLPRLPQMHSKQNLNIYNISYPSLIEILNKDTKLFDNFLK